VITAKINMERIRSKAKILQRGSLPAQMAYKEPTATNADTMWRLGHDGSTWDLRAQQEYRQGKQEIDYGF
jgi:hypothetical protein